MERNSIRIQKRIPPLTYELAMIALLDGSLTQDYIVELAAHECEGEVRRKKTATVIKFLTLQNPLLQYIKDHAQEIEIALKRKENRDLMFIAQLSAEYPFVYDTVSAFGKFFHAQEEVSKALIAKKLSEKYGSNEQLEVSLKYVITMLTEAGFLQRLKVGIYCIRKFDNISESAFDVYKRSFLLNNPNIAPNDDFMSNPYFEYIRQ